MLECHGQTDIGRNRKLNEDRIFVESGLVIVCDGMGGHNAGEVAAHLAQETIVTFVRRSEQDDDCTWPYGIDPRLSYNANRLRTAIKLANRTVFRKAASAEAYTGMGTTVTAALVTPKGTMTYGHVGDSRVYLIRGGVILQLTHDDTWANLARGDWNDEDPELAPMRNVLTKAIGVGEEVDFDVVDHSLRDRDLVLLCSDGLTNMLPDERILTIVLAYHGDGQRTCSELILSANAEGGRDNISVILVRYLA